MTERVVLPELSPEQVAATVIEILECASPLHQEKIRDVACDRHPGRINLVMIKQSLAALQAGNRVQGLSGGVWALVRAAGEASERSAESAAGPIASPSIAEFSRGLKASAGPGAANASPEAQASAPDGSFEPLTEYAPTLTNTAPSGQTQDQLWNAFERSLQSPLRALPKGFSPEIVIAAHEWSLATPLLIRSAEDFKAIPSLKVEPFLHQVRAAIAFFRRLNPRGLIADDVGLGKTVTAGLILLELIERKKVQGFAIIAPKMIQEQWQRELREKFGIEAAIATGRELKQLQPGARIITTYQSAATHLEGLKQARIDLVVFDEMHKLRNLHSPQPPKMALAVYAAMKERAFRYCLGLSATPLQNSLRDLFSLADILRAPNPTPYGTLKQFESYYLADDTGRRLKPAVVDEFRRRTSEFMHRTSRRDSKLPFPERQVVVRTVVPSADERKLLAIALQTVFGAKSSAFQRIGLAQTILSSPAAALAAIDRKNSEEALESNELRALRDQFVALRETAKSRALVELVREIQKRSGDWRVLIFTIRRATADFIRDALDRAGLRDVVAVMQGGQARANQQAIEDFQASPPRRRVLVSTDAGAEGVNLQTCNVVVNFDLPWNPMIVEQRIGRVQRLGQKAKNVIVYNLVTKGTIEESVVSRLYEKLALYDAAIGLAEEILGQIADEDESFEAIVLKLAERAVLRGDEQTAIDVMRKNAEEARKELQQQLKDIDDAFGSTDDHALGPRVPEIQPVKPSLSDRDFWTAAMRAAGWTLRERDGGRTLEATRDGRKARRFTFDPDHPDRSRPVLGAYAVELVAPDERPFEELVNSFSQTGIDATEKALVDVEAVLVPEILRLLRPRVAEVRAHEKVSRAVALRVTPVARVNVNVAHDQYEKLVTATEVKVTTVIAGDAPPAAPLATRASAQAISNAVRAAVEADSDIRSFRSFYEARRAEEIARIQRSRDERTLNGATAERLIEDQRQRLTPLIEARLVCVRGTAEEAARLQMSLVLDSGRSVDVELPLLPRKPLEEALRALSSRGSVPTVCDGGHWADQDDLVKCVDGRCPLQGCALCTDWQRCIECGQAKCAAHGTFCAGCNGGLCSDHVLRTHDGKPACRNCIGECAVSHFAALTNELVRCEDTLELVMSVHATRSAASGKWIRASNAVRSEVSGAEASPDEMEVCSITGKKALPSELITSQPAGRRILAEVAAQCADTKAYFEPDTLVRCAVCNAAVAPNRLVPSDVSGTLAHDAECVRCAITGKRALPTEVQRSPVSNRVAVSSVFVQCEVTGTLALPDEVANCGETGKRVLRARLRASAKTGRLALAELTSSCAVCGKTLLKSEMVSCAVTKRLADPACMAESAVSGAKAVASAMATCALSGRRVLPSELVQCRETQRLVARDRVGTCAFTGIQVAIDGLVLSAHSNEPVRRSVAEASDATRRLVGPGELVATRSGLKVLPDECEDCPVCGFNAVLGQYERNERLVCSSCGIVCCAADGRPDSRCLLCEGALAETKPASPPSTVQAGAPKFKNWSAKSGAHQTVWIGRPGLIRFYERPVLIRASNDGKVLFERKVD